MSSIEIKVGGVRGINGDPGEDGWEPIISIYLHTDGKRYLKITDWVGGTGVKPAADLYMSAAGYVEDVADAVSVSPEGGFGKSILEIQANTVAQKGKTYVVTSGQDVTITLPAANTIGADGFDFDVISDSPLTDIVFPNGFLFHQGWSTIGADATYNFMTFGSTGIQNFGPNTIVVGRCVARVRVTAGPLPLAYLY